MTLFEWIVVGGVWGIVVVWSLALMLAAGRRTAPPAGPRGRLVRDRERAGRVEVLPTLGDAENARKRAERRAR